MRMSALLVAAAASASAACMPVRAQQGALQRIGPAPQEISDIQLSRGPDHDLWVATRGGGVFRVPCPCASAGRAAHFDVTDLLPSASVSQLAPLGQDIVLVGTAAGAVWLDAAKKSAVPRPGAVAGPVSIARVSPRDDSLLLQVMPDEELPALKLPTLQRFGKDRGHGQDRPESIALRATAAALDTTGKCLLIGGVVESDAKGRRVLRVLSECDRDEGRSLPWTLPPELVPDAESIVGLAAQDGKGDVLLAVRRQKGVDVATRRDELLLLGRDRRVQLCRQGGDMTRPVTGMVAWGGRWAVAREGEGVLLLNCAVKPARATDPAGLLTHATALGLDFAGRLIVGTRRGLFAIASAGSAPERLALVDAGAPGMPAEAIPVDLWEEAAQRPRVLAVSGSEGVVELRLADPAVLERRWPGESETMAILPSVFGEAKYAGPATRLVLLPSRGVVPLDDRRMMEPLRLDKPLSNQVVHLAVDRRDGSFWLATGAMPFDPEGGGLQHYSPDGQRLLGTVRLPDPRLQVSSLRLEGDTLWVGTLSGLLALERSRPPQRVFRTRVERIVQDPGAHLPAVVGATVARASSDGRWSPATFASPQGNLGHPVDGVIDAMGRWTLLYSSGVLVQLGAGNELQSVLGAKEHVPPSAARLLYVPSEDLVLVGTRQEGLFSLRRPGR